MRSLIALFLVCLLAGCAGTGPVTVGTPRATAAPAKARLPVSDCEVFLESREALIASPKKSEKLFLAFSCREGKPQRGLAWLIPPLEGRFPQVVPADTSVLEMTGDSLRGRVIVKTPGLAPHICAIDARIYGDKIHGTLAVEAQGKSAEKVITGEITPPTASRDAPMIDPADVPLDKPWGEIIKVDHPYIFWTRDEAAAIRKRIESDPDAKKQYELTLERAKDAPTFANLFKYLVMDDKAAGDVERRYLLSFIGTHPSNFYTGIGGGRHFDNYLHALRYDVLYDTLSAEERRQLEHTFRGFLKHHVYEDYKRRYTRTNWLPNMQWPRPMAAHIMAVALRDREAIRRMFHSVGGWKWYMDEYVADGRFYMEEFGKQYSMIGEMLLWCKGLERLGLDAWGFGYTGKGGATMHNYIESLYSIALPRVENPGGTPSYRHIHMGDAGASCLVGGYKADGSLVTRYGGYFRGANMNGRDHTQRIVSKMMTPLWFEAAHAQWPDDHFDYALAHMHRPGEDKYYPTLLFGLSPLDPKTVTPPPAPSFAARERGFAMLRAEEGSGYWTSPKPAVALQFGMYYVHYVHDCFTLIEYYAFNRPLYEKRQFGPHRGYRGGHPWRDTVRGHNGVVVDGMQVQPIDDGDHGCAHQQIRDSFTDTVKFVAARAKPYTIETKDYATGETKTMTKALYENTDLERGLFLTDEYLLDILRVVSDKPRAIHWNVHPLGAPDAAALTGWQPSKDFDGGKLWGGNMAAKTKGGAFDLKNLKKLDVGAEAWRFQVQQGDGIGVVLRMLGSAGTSLYHDTDGQVTTVLAARQAPATTFTALHEHYKGDPAHVRAFERLAETDDAIAVRITGKGKSPVNDIAAFAFADKADAETTVEAGGHLLVFKGQLHVRMGADGIDVSGTPVRLKLDIESAVPPLRINGKEQPAGRDGKLLVWPARQ